MSSETLAAALALIGIVILVSSLLSGVIERTGLPQVAAFLLLGAVYDGTIDGVPAADRLLARSPGQYATFVALLEDVGRAWGAAATGHPGRGQVAFHTVLVVSPDRLAARRNWRAARLDG